MPDLVTLAGNAVGVGVIVCAGVVLALALLSPLLAWSAVRSLRRIADELEHLTRLIDSRTADTSSGRSRR